jgi:phosphotransferase system IIB component/uncharacterized membrane protein
MKNYDMLCQAILKEIGSKDNVSFVTHCMTRLRMNLKDEGLVDMETVKKIPEVLGCQFSGEQFQIIIGPEVSEVYPVFLKSAGMENQEVGGEVEDKAFCWKNIPKRVMDAVIGSVTPIFPIISAAGIIKLLAALLGPSMLVMLPVTLCMVGPGNLIGQGSADGLVWINGVIGPLAVGLVGALWYFLVAAGLHQALAPIAFQNMAAIGYDSIIAVGAITGTYAVMGLAVALFCGDQKKTGL